MKRRSLPSENLVQMAKLRGWLLRESGSKASADPDWVHRYEALGLQLFLLVTPSLTRTGLLRTPKDVHRWGESLAVSAAEKGDLAGAAFAANLLQYLCGAIGAPAAARRGIA